jgi:hypothetical protein
VSYPQIVWSSEVQAADWLVSRLTTGQPVVSSVIPVGFAAYMRLLHPAHARDGAPVRWGELAARAHVALEPGTQFEALRHRSGWQGEPPTEGSLPADQAVALAGVLADVTTTPHRCWFCLWDGYGWLYEGRSVRRLARPGQAASPPVTAWAAVEPAPRVHAPNRDYVLYAGPLDAATALAGAPWQQAPNVWWPDDHAWCVVSDIDLACTYVGGSGLLVDRLLADTRFEALAVHPTSPLAAGDDGPGAGG